MIETNMMRFVHLVSFLILLCSHLQHKLYAATDSILPGQQISYPETIISAGGVFELGFFTPGNSTNYYVGIWYNKIPEQTVVWVANRDYPVSGTSGVLTINTDGNLVISDRQFLYMVTNTTSKGNTSATLLDSGNLILKDLNSVVLWQSFDNPSHVLLPGMKLGINKRTGSASSLVSWKSTDDPGIGAFSLKLDEQNSQYCIMQGTHKNWVSGYWNGNIFSSVSEMRLNYIYKISYTSNENESYFTYSVYNYSTFSRWVMDVSGQIEQLTWLESSQQWNLFWAQPRHENQCEVYAYCGSYGVCNQEDLDPCQCLFGFEPHSSEAWRQKDRSGGCTRKVPQQCEDTTAVNGEEDKFLKISNMKIPANGQQVVVGNGKKCNFACLNNCSCSAYAYDGSSGCSIWTGDLLNLQQLQAKNWNGSTIYVKLAASELPGSGGNKKLLFLIILVVASLLLGCYFGCQWRNKCKQKGNMEPGQNILLFDMGLSTSTTNNELSSNKAVGSGKSNDSGLPLFSFASVSAATEDFSEKNKLGEGGFGPVYKGQLIKGHEIAVKRLSKKSGQGLEELKNEVVLIAKLQHRNLVKILGCCLEQEEKILIYEYMPNKSLDTFLFAHSARRGLLDWRARVRIVEGIAQGVLYLHQYSRLRIIHRDLKASNILLDADKNPKISDFGMARIFGGNETQANTNRIAGTYGYMAPEYALEGIFSEKSDVFSFGVLLMEIVSGKKNTGFYLSDSLNLLGYAWDLWIDDKALDLMDPVWEDESSKNILMRYIHVALLCVQEIAADRPTMSEVVSMLTNEGAVLLSPKQPAFSNVRTVKTLNALMSRPEICSKNEVTVSLLEAR